MKSFERLALGWQTEAEAREMLWPAQYSGEGTFPRGMPQTPLQRALDVRSALELEGAIPHTYGLVTEAVRGGTAHVRYWIAVRGTYEAPEAYQRLLAIVRSRVMLTPDWEKALELEGADLLPRGWSVEQKTELECREAHTGDWRRVARDAYRRRNDEKP